MSLYLNLPACVAPSFVWPGGTDTIVNIDESNAGAAIKVTGRPFVNAANDVFGGITVTRYNRSRFIRVTNYVSDRITFMGQAVPGGLGYIGVLVNGTLVATQHLNNATASPAWYTVTGLGAGSKTVDLIEDFQDRLNQLDTGLDGSAAGTYVTKVVIPAGQGTITKPTATNVIAVFGDSHVDGDATNPCSYYGWAGQLRKAAAASGSSWMVGYVGAGSSTLCGDGPTAAETADMISDLWAQTGATNKYFLLMRRPNDYAYWSFPSSIQTTPAQYQTYLEAIQTALDVSDAGWTGIYTRIPQGTGWTANGGGYTLDNYWTATTSAATSGGRANVTTHDKTVFTSAGLSLSNASHFFEASPNQVHLAQAGHDIVAPVVNGWYGL